MEKQKFSGVELLKVALNEVLSEKLSKEDKMKVLLALEVLLVELEYLLLKEVKEKPLNNEEIKNIFNKLLSEIRGD